MLVGRIETVEGEGSDVTYRRRVLHAEPALARELTCAAGVSPAPRRREMAPCGRHTEPWG